VIARERRIPLYFALLLYGSMAVAALIWIEFRGTRSLTAMLWEPPAGLPAAAGVSAGIFMAAAAAAMSVTLPAFRSLETEFAQICADQRGVEIALLALMSGAAEELFFRGAMQQEFARRFGVTGGVLATALIFGLVHVPLSRRMMTWPLLACVSGVVLGALMAWTESLLAPMAAHIVVNAVGLWRIARRYGTPRLERE
jgi:membrane protease YdiL (CAAX protease family)